MFLVSSFTRSSLFLKRKHERKSFILKRYRCLLPLRPPYSNATWPTLRMLVFALCEEKKYSFLSTYVASICEILYIYQVDVGMEMHLWRRSLFLQERGLAEWFCADSGSASRRVATESLEQTDRTCCCSDFQGERDPDFSRTCQKQVRQCGRGMPAG